MLYLAWAVGIFANMATAAMRSHLSKLVDLDEIGKVMSALALIQVSKMPWLRNFASLAVCTCI